MFRLLPPLPVPLQVPFLETTIVLLTLSLLNRLVSPLVAKFSMESLLETVGNSSALALLASAVRQALHWMGVSVEQMPSKEVIAFSFFICVCSLLGSIHHWRRRKQLKRQLRTAQAKLNYLQEKLRRPTTDSAIGEKKEIRIFMDGAFDLQHFGHMNAFRLARSLGTHLVVGVNSDESITRCKGAPLMSDHERLTMVSSCKFVDEVIPNCPYIMSSEYLDWAIEKYSIDYVIHGDDPCIVDGKDVYEAAKKAGKFRTIPRTCGVSTTDIVGRMLLLTKDHHYHDEQQQQDQARGSGSSSGDSSDNGRSNNPPSSSGKLGRSSALQLVGQQSKFLTTSRMLQLFSADVQAPTNEMRVIYIDGAWDLFHPGHVATLKAASERGDYLIVGIHGDAVVNSVQGMNLPLMNLHERVLSVLGCRYVNDVLIDAPYEVTHEMIASLNISEVVRARRCQDASGSNDDAVVEPRFRHAKAAGILKVLHVPTTFQIGNVIQRIQKNQVAFQAKFERKMAAEQDYLEGLTSKSS